MTTQSDIPQNTPSEATDKSSVGDNIPTSTNDAKPNTNINQPVQSNPDVVPKKEVEALLAKVRREEKSKLYPEIEKLKEKSIELETVKISLEAQMLERQKEIEELRAGKLGELESVNKELNNLREHNKKLSEDIANVASVAADKITKYQLETYKERRIREAGLSELHDMVLGSTEEEVEASLKAAVDKESSIFNKAKEDALAQLAKDLPRPLAPDGSHGRDVLSTMTPKKRDSIVNSPDYSKLREEILAEAKKKIGMQ